MAKKKVETETVVEAPVDEKSVNLSVADLHAAVQIIDFAAARGAFTGDNLTKVGQVRDRIAEVVRAIAPAEETATEADAGQA